jgi:hypothetical protein
MDETFGHGACRQIHPADEDGLRTPTGGTAGTPSCNVHGLRTASRHRSTATRRNCSVGQLGGPVPGTPDHDQLIRRAPNENYPDGIGDKSSGLESPGYVQGPLTLPGPVRNHHA